MILSTIVAIKHPNFHFTYVGTALQKKIRLGLGSGLGLVGYARRDYFFICYIGICPTSIGNDRPNIRFFNGTVGSSKSVSFE